MNETDPTLSQRVWTDGQHHTATINDDLGLAISVVKSRQDLNEGRLAGAVLPKQAVDFAVTDRQADIIERCDASEALVEPVNLQNEGRVQRRGALRRPGP